MTSLARRLLNRLTGASRRGMLEVSGEDRALVQQVVESNLTYLTPQRLHYLASLCRRRGQARVEGVFLEAGCALGGSTVLLSRLKPPGAALRVYDVFATIPAPTPEDGPDVHARYAAILRGESRGINGDAYYGYEKNLLDIVRRNLTRFQVEPQRDRVELIQGLVQDTLRVDEPVAFAHVDVDWYEPVKTCLERIVPRLSRGGALVLDDYNDWSGCRKATDEYFSRPSPAYRMDNRHGVMTITRTA